MTTPTKPYLGTFEYVLLKSMAQYTGQHTALKLIERIETQTGRRFSVGAVYTTLSRLCDKGFALRSRISPGARNGRPASVGFQITAAGEIALQRTWNLLTLKPTNWRPAGRKAS